MSDFFLNKHLKWTQKGKNDFKIFLLCRISNYEARTEKRIIKFGPGEKSLATPGL